MPIEALSKDICTKLGGEKCITAKAQRDEDFAVVCDRTQMNRLPWSPILITPCLAFPDN